MIRPFRTLARATLLLVAACQSAEPEDVSNGFVPATFDRADAGAREASAPRASARVPRSDPAGFYTEERDGRLWVFRTDDMALLRFLESGEPATSVTLVGAGPLGATLRGPDRTTLVEYLGQVPGYHAELVDGRLWVFEEGSAALDEFLAGRKPEKNATKVGVGPLGTSLRGAELRVLREYLYTKPGFRVALGTVGEREFLWVFRTDSDALAEFEGRGEPAKSVTRIGAGPDGLTLRGPDREVLDAYARAR